MTIKPGDIVESLILDDVTKYVVKEVKESYCNIVVVYYTNGEKQSLNSLLELIESGVYRVLRFTY